MLNVSRISHARFETPDLARQEDYYTRILGLVVVGRESGRIHLAPPRGRVAVVLEQAERPHCTGIGFQVSGEGGLDEAASTLRGLGIASEVQSDIAPGISRALTFVDPKGTRMEVLAQADIVADRTQPAGGIHPLKLGHIAFKTPDIQKTAQFYREVMGFRVSDWRADFFVFMRCGPDHHTINFIAGDSPRMHHIAFELSDGPAMLRACDHLGLSGAPVIWGPGRHVIGGNMFTYHRNPDNQIMELYTDLAQIKSEALGEFEARPWHWDDVYKPRDWPSDTLSNLWGPPSPPGFRD